MQAFVDVQDSSGFGLHNLPWGVFSSTSSSSSSSPRIGVALGDHVIDVAALQQAGLFAGPILSTMGSCLYNASLNEFMSLGKPAWSEARSTLQRLLSAQEGVLRDNVTLRDRAILHKDQVQMHVPADIGDYTDFYASRQHAFNCGALFRGPGQELQPNWGQVLPAGSSVPVMSPSTAFDFELEMACFIGSGNKLGEPMRVDQASDNIFGMVLLNDWSARDIQKWEIVPLGPFNSKNFATQISPWIVTMEALEPFSCPAPAQDPELLPYLREHTRRTHDVQLAVDIVPAEAQGQACRVSATNFNTMYYTWAQMLAHHTLGGCPLRPGDLIGSGTVSGGGTGQMGCMFEATQGGKQALELRGVPQGGGVGAGPFQRVYLQDGDEVVLTGRCEGQDGLVVSFGECRGVVLPATPTTW